MESVGFKEWSMVCDALGRGLQHVIIRKGGIAEGRDGFSFRHESFFLIPTWFHEQAEKVRDAGMAPQAHDESRIDIDFFAKVEEARVIADWETVMRLEPLHIWRREVARERFDYAEKPGVHVAFVRVFRMEPRWTLPNESRYGGCRSWVTLPPGPEVEFGPVLSDAEYALRRKQFIELTADSAAVSTN